MNALSQELAEVVAGLWVADHYSLDAIKAALKIEPDNKALQEAYAAKMAEHLYLLQQN